MHRRALLGLLEDHTPHDDRERGHHVRLRAFVEQHADCFERSCRPGHITGSAWVLNVDGTQALLTFHRKLRRWLQPGGHADGDSDVRRVALREAREESGLMGLAVLEPGIFDVDIHTIPARGPDPEHEHFDVRFLIGATGEAPLQISSESTDLRWWSPDALSELNPDASIARMITKWRKRLGD